MDLGCAAGRRSATKPNPRAGPPSTWLGFPMSTSRVKLELRISAASAGLLMTPEEFDAIADYDDRYRYELIRGVLVVNPIPSEAEGDPNEELGHLLRSYKEAHP